MTYASHLTEASPRASRRGLPVIALAVTLISGYASLAMANLFGSEEPLSPELAFIPEIVNVTDQTIDVEFSIEDEYYLYRDKTSFSVSDVVTASQPSANSLGALISNASDGQDPLELSAPVFGDALVIEDDFFGKQAIFRDSTLISVPYVASGDIDSLTMAVKYQGCADMGLCYPPTTVMLDVELPESSTMAQSPSPLGAADSSSPLIAPSSSSRSAPQPLNDVLNGGAGTDELLPPELAYLPQITAATSESINVRWFIEDGYYLYRDKLSFSLQHPDGLVITQGLVSPGVEQFDDFFGNVSVLRHEAEAQLVLNSEATRASGSVAASEGQLVINYQGCADIGVCFPPTQTTLPVSFTDGVPPQNLSAALAPLANNGDGNGGSNRTQGTSGNTTSTVAAQTATDSAAPAQSEQDRLSNLLGSSSLWLTIATFFGLGLLLAFTPCVLPMIPILSSLIVGQGQSMSTGRAFQLSLVYVLVMASTYALVGVVVGLSGYNVQAFLQHPYVLSGIAVLFVLLSLSMFGFYELQMPASVQNRLTQWSNKQSGGQVGGVAAMGFISTLIVGPCITAPLAGALIYIAKTGDAVVGGTALFSLGLGMGAPLLLIGTSAGKLVPKAGAWMDATKHIFGILMLGMAIYMISRFLPTTITMALYGVLALMSGVYLGATDSISRQSSGWHRFGKGAGLVVAIYGIALLLGALAGGASYTTPLGALAGSANTSAGESAGSGTEHALPFQRVKSIDNLTRVVAQASAEGRPVMLDFYADWCISCKEMEAFTFSDKRVQDLLSSAVVVQADVTANDAEDQALLKYFDLFGPPGIIFYDTSGTELPAARVVGFMNADNFSAHIRRFIYSGDT